MKEQLIISEIDVERLRAERRANTTFAANAAMLTHDDEKGIFTVETERVGEKEFTLTRRVDAHPFVPTGRDLDERCREIFSIQTAGLAKRVQHTQAETVVVGISGGLDSTLALLVCVKTFDMLGMSRRGIVGITMPGFGTTDRTYTNAVNLMKLLGITIREISIRDAVTQHFADLGHDMSVHDVTYENSQARERTQILMDAANQTNGFVVGTGDLSEMALGWCTYNGDHMSMYGVNAGVPKTLVRHLVAWIAEPITCPSDARIAPTTAERHPESTAASCHSTFRKPPLSTLPLFLSRGMMTTIVTPTISSTAPIARCQPSGITLAPNHPKWSMHKLNISWLNMGITIACSWPNSLKRCMAMVIVISGIMPMNQLHHGAS